MSFKSTYRILLIAFSLYLVNIQLVKAQNCSDRIEISRLLYETGKFSQIIDTLKECSLNENEDIKFSALRLLTKAYLMSNEKVNARNTAIKLLQIHPNYKPSPLSNSKDFIKLINSITVLPKLTFGVSLALGTNFSIPKASNVYSVLNSNAVTYKSKQGFNIEISGAYLLTNTIGAFADFSIIQKKYEIDYSIPGLKLNAEEKLTYAIISIGAKYAPIIKSKVKPYLHLGVYGGRLLEGVGSYSSESTEFGEKSSLENISTEKRRNLYDYGINGSLGFYYRIKNGQLNIKCTYMHSFQNITKTEERFNYSKLTSAYFHLDDDIKLSSMTFSIGYSLLLKYKVLDL